MKRVKYLIGIILIAGLLSLVIYNYYKDKYNKKPYVSSSTHYNKNLNYEAIFSIMHANGIYGKHNLVDKYYLLLQDFFLDNHIHKVVALGCANWKYMNEIISSTDTQYFCYDVVPQIIHENNDKFSSDNVHFYYIETLNDFVNSKISGDLLIVGDFLQYWDNTQIKQFIDNSLVQFKYTILTNTYTNDASNLNKDITLGNYRPINLLDKPFKLSNATAILEYESPQSHNLNQILLFVSKH